MGAPALILSKGTEIKPSRFDRCADKNLTKDKATYMGFIDWLSDNIFHGGEKKKFLNALWDLLNDINPADTKNVLAKYNQIATMLKDMSDLTNKPIQEGNHHFFAFYLRDVSHSDTPFKFYDGLAVYRQKNPENAQFLDGLSFDAENPPLQMAESEKNPTTSADPTTLPAKENLPKPESTASLRTRAKKYKVTLTQLGKLPALAIKAGATTTELFIHLAKNKDQLFIYLNQSPGKVDINQQDRFGKTILHYAAMIPDNKEVLELLCEQNGINFNIKDRQHNTPVHIAGKKANELDFPHMVRIALSKGFDCGIKDDDGFTILHHAAFSAHADSARMYDDGKNCSKILKILQEHKGNNLHALLNELSVSKYSALMYCIQFGAYDEAKALIEAGASANVEGQLAETSPLMVVLKRRESLEIEKRNVEKRGEKSAQFDNRITELLTLEAQLKS